MRIAVLTDIHANREAFETVLISEIRVQETGNETGKKQL